MLLAFLHLLLLLLRHVVSFLVFLVGDWLLLRMEEAQNWLDELRWTCWLSNMTFVGGDKAGLVWVFSGPGC